MKINNLTLARVMNPNKMKKPGSVLRSISVQTSVEKLMAGNKQPMPELEEEIKSELKSFKFPETEHHSIDREEETK